MFIILFLTHFLSLLCCSVIFRGTKLRFKEKTKDRVAVNEMNYFGVFLLIFNFLPFISNDPTDPNSPLSWYESLPAVAMDYKMHIDAGKYF